MLMGRTTGWRKYSRKLISFFLWCSEVIATGIRFCICGFLHVELIQLRCGRNKTVIRFSTLKFIVLLLLLFPVVHSGISKYLFFSLSFLHSPLSLFPSQRWPSQSRLLGPESSMSMLNLYTSPSLPNISLGLPAASSPISVSQVTFFI